MNQDQIKIEVYESGTAAVVLVRGGIDAYVVTRVKEAISQLVEEEKYRVVIDFSEVGQINSTALGIIIGRLRRVRMHGGDIKVANLHSEIRKIFDVMGASRIFEIYEDVEAAVAAFGPEN